MRRQYRMRFNSIWEQRWRRQFRSQVPVHCTVSSDELANHQEIHFLPMSLWPCSIFETDYEWICSPKSHFLFLLASSDRVHSGMYDLGNICALLVIYMMMRWVFLGNISGQKKFIVESQAPRIITLKGVYGCCRIINWFAINRQSATNCEAIDNQKGSIKSTEGNQMYSIFQNTLGNGRMLMKEVFMVVVSCCPHCNINNVRHVPGFSSVEYSQ